MPKQMLKHEFVILNNGSEPASILDVKTSCSCLIAGKPNDLIGRSIDPGEKITVPAFLNTRNMTNRITGRIVVQFEGESSSSETGPETQFVSLRVGADSQPDVTITPEKIDFGNIDILKQATVSQEIRIQPVDKTPVKWAVGAIGNSAITIDPIQDSSDRYLVTVDIEKLSQRTNDAILKSQIEFNLTDSAMDRIFLPVSASHTTPVKVAPKFVSVGSHEKGAVSKSVQIQTTYPSRILKIDASEHDDVEIVFDEYQTATTHEIKIKFTKDAKGNGEFRIALMLDLDEGNQVEYPLSIEFFLFR